MKKYNDNSNKNHSHRTYGQILSDMFSSDVLHSILSSPTDTLQALNEAFDDAKVRKNTESTITKLKNFFNNDFKIRFNAPFQVLRRDLRKLFSMDLNGATDYAVYNVPSGKMAFRLADHNANGNKFEQDEAEVNISVFVAFKEYNVPESKIPFTEFKIKPEIFESKRESVIRAIIIAVQNALNGDDFDIPEEFADRVDYPLNNSEINIQTDKTENSNYNYNMAKNSKMLYESIMNDVSKSVRRKMYENYVEDNEYLYDDIMESVSKIVKRNLNETVNDLRESSIDTTCLNLLLNILRGGMRNPGEMQGEALYILSKMHSKCPDSEIWWSDDIINTLDYYFHHGADAEQKKTIRKIWNR